jgi:hypothetical protein
VDQQDLSEKGHPGHGVVRRPAFLSESCLPLSSFR